MTPEKKVVSVGAELEEIRMAVEAAGLLAGALATHQLATEHQVQQAPRYIAAVLWMVAVRLEHVGRTVAGYEDPRRVWAAHNAGGPGVLAPDEQDVLLEAWDDAGELKKPWRR